MKYLLVGVNAKYIHSNLALICLRSYARKYACATPELCEFTINMSIDEMVCGIYKRKPDFIAFSVYIWNVNIIMQIVRDIKILLPETVIFLGGPEVSYNSIDILKTYPEVKGVMLGEGEQTFSELINHYETHSVELNDIPGICYRDDNLNDYITTASRSPIDLSTLPFPYDNLSDYDNKIIYYESSRGCPFGCAYCLSSVDKTLRFRNLDMVKRELKIFLDAEVPQVKLVDRTFNIDHRRSIEMITFLRDNDNGITNFHFEIAGDILTDEEIELINSLRPGLIQLEIGVQSTNPCTLDAINRRTDLIKLRENVAKLLCGGKVHLHLDLIAGLPYENLNSFKKSFNDVYSMNSHELQLGFLKVLKGAPIIDLANDQNIKHSARAPYEVLSTEYLSYNDICELKRVEEMLEIYHNSGQFTYSESFLLAHEKTPYDMYYNLSCYYIERNLSITQCKRFVRYEIFLDYCVNKHNLTSEESNLLRSLLTLDYYSREKAKARPSFAIPVDSFKDNLRKIKNELNKNNPHGLYHVEPIFNNTFAVFDYNKRSVITGNVEYYTVS